MIGFIVMYIVFFGTLTTLCIFYKNKLSKKLLIIYFIYWHILLLNIAFSVYFFSGQENESGILLMRDIDYYLLPFFLVFFPFGIFYIKNTLVKKYSGDLSLNILTNMLLDFIKMLLMTIFVVGLTTLISSLFEK